MDLKRKVKKTGHVKTPKLSKKNKLVLVVDDQVDFLHEAHEMLTDCGYSCKFASSGDEALRSAKNNKPDVILLDIVMNGMNGFRVAEELKKYSVTADIPIIAITGWFVRDTHEELLKKLGVKSILMKPLNPDNLISSISQVLESRV